MDLSGYTLATLHQDTEFVLCRGRATANPTPQPASVRYRCRHRNSLHPIASGCWNTNWRCAPSSIRSGPCDRSLSRNIKAARPWCSQIGELIAFDRAIRVGIDFAVRHPRTLLIVTGDHGQTGQIVPMPTDTDHPIGLISALQTKEGATMVLSYSTNVYHRPQDHTGTQVRIGAMGPQAANVVGVLDQTDVFRILSRALESRSSKSTSAGAR